MTDEATRVRVDDPLARRERRLISGKSLPARVRARLKDTDYMDPQLRAAQMNFDSLDAYYEELRLSHNGMVEDFWNHEHEPDIVTSTDSATISGSGGTASYNWQPSNYGWFGWTFDPVIISAGTAITNDTIHLTSIVASVTGTFTNIGIFKTVADATANTVRVGIFNRSGVRVADTANFASSLTAGSNTFHSIALQSSLSVTQGDEFWFGIWKPASDPTSAQFAALSIVDASTNAGLSAANSRVGRITSATTWPTSFDTSLIQNTGNSFYFGAFLP